MGSPEFEEIRQILREVAESQKDTDRKFKETDKKFQDTDRKFQDTDRKFQETDKKFQDTALRLQETDKIIKETDKIIKETVQSIKETEKLVNSVSKQIGNVHRSIGHSAEAYFQTAMGKTLTFAGIGFDDMLSNIKRTKKHGRNCEFDMVLVNHEAVAVIDAKHRIHREQVEELATKKVAIFREFFPEYKDCKVYLGLAGFSLEDDAEAAARTYGVGLLKQDGNAVKTVDIPLKAY